MNTVEKAYQIALDARKKSYSPYSKFAVGAALKLKDRDVIVPGCNVENASYGGTWCAERSAVVSAVSQYGKVPFEFIIVVTATEPASMPCAFCRGVLSEFCSPDFVIYLANEKGIEKKITLGELLPYPFLLDPV